MGTRGISACIRDFRPSHAIVLEGTTSADMPFDTEANVSTIPGNGPALTVLDRTTICDPGLIKLFRSIAKRHSIPIQSKQSITGGTDARVIQKNYEGVKVIALSVPVRYIHSNISQVQLSDVHNSLKLLSCVTRRLTAEI